MNGKIILITGPMFAGKTEMMIGMVLKYHHAGLKACFVKYSDDHRYSRYKIITHNKYSQDTVIELSSTTIGSISLDKYDVIGISESQFFEDIDLVDNLANKGKIVICEGLCSSFMRTAFGNLHKLFPIADDIINLKGVCKCGRESNFTSKYKDKTNHPDNIGKNDIKNKDMETDKMVELGGPELYKTVCRNCHKMN